MNDLVPRDQLVRQGSRGVGGVVGGAGLLILHSIAAIGAGFSLPGIIVGGVLAVTGAGLASGTKTDKTGGMVLAGAGVLTGLASLPIIGGLASGLMWVAGLGLLGVGGVNLFRFIRGMRKRR
ncbi:MAG: hypothetical protein ACLFO1_02425 [Spirochaetaceae bacterium]